MTMWDSTFLGIEEDKRGVTMGLGQASSRDKELADNTFGLNLSCGRASLEKMLA